MDDLTLNLIVLAVTGVAIAGLFLYLSQRKRKHLAQFEVAARARGWRTRRVEEPLVSGVVIEGGQAGATWTLEAMTHASSTSAGPGSSEVSQSMRWFSPGITLPGRSVVVGPALPGGMASAAMLDSPLARKALDVMLGGSAAWVSGLKPVTLDNAPGLLCMADSPEDARRLVGRQAFACLSVLPAHIKTVIILRDPGLEMRLPSTRLDDPDDIARFIELGEGLMADWKTG